MRHRGRGGAGVLHLSRSDHGADAAWVAL